MAFSKVFCFVFDGLNVGFLLGIHVREEVHQKIVRSGPLLTIFSVQFDCQTDG